MLERHYDRAGVGASMSQADVPLSQAERVRGGRGCAVQKQRRATGLASANLDVTPADGADAGAKRFGDGFFSSEPCG